MFALLLVIACVVLSSTSGGADGHPGAAPLTVLHVAEADRLVLAPVRMEGFAPLTFVLDSGARHTCFDSVTAAALDLHELAADSSQGVGRGSVRRQHLAPVELSVGGVHFAVQDPWVFDLRHVGISRRVDGMLGADLLERFVVRVDPVGHTLALLDPAAFHPEGSGTSIPLALDDDRLYVDMRLHLAGGVSEVRRMRIDTGSGDAVSDNLVRRSSERRRSVQGVGLGQPYVDYSGVFDSVELGPYAIAHCWGPSNDHPAVGMEILRRFTLTFDVPHRRLYLLPNAHLHDPVPPPGR